MTSATLQNNVRLRIVLIFILSIFVSTAREFATDSVHKATAQLQINYIIYSIILLVTIVPFKASWVISVILGGATVVIGGLSTVLATIATVRCVSAQQVGCIQTLPGSIVTLILSGIIVAIDIYQTWNLYLISRYPTFKTSAAQRIRIIFSWALPFAWLLNVKSIVEDQWSWMFITHLLVDPLFIVMANSEEKFFLIVVTFATLAIDVLALTIQTHYTHILIIQLAMTFVGGLMAFLSKANTYQKKKPKQGDGQMTNTDNPEHYDIHPETQFGAIKQRNKSQNLKF